MKSQKKTFVVDGGEHIKEFTVTVTPNFRRITPQRVVWADVELSVAWHGKSYVKKATYGVSQGGDSYLSAFETDGASDDADEFFTMFPFEILGPWWTVNVDGESKSIEDFELEDEVRIRDIEKDVDDYEEEVKLWIEESFDRFFTSDEQDALAEIKHVMLDFLAYACSDEYAQRLVEELHYDVYFDVTESSRNDGFNNSDVRFALGRVLLDRLGV